MYIISNRYQHLKNTILVQYHFIVNQNANSKFVILFDQTNEVKMF